MCSILFLLGSADLKSGQEQKYIDAQLIFDWLTDIAKSLHHFIALAVKSIKDYFFNAYKSRHDLQSRVINSKFHILYSLKFFVISLWKSLRNEVNSSNTASVKSVQLRMGMTLYSSLLPQ